jgi:hypothetical protein
VRGQVRSARKIGHAPVMAAGALSAVRWSVVRSMDAVFGLCGRCGKAVRAAAVMYTAEARLVCPVCFTKADVSARRRAMFEGWRGALLGAIAGGIPFVVRVIGWLMVTVPDARAAGRDWIALGSGVVAVLCGGVTIVAARSWASGGWLAIGALIALVGAYHVVRGAGVAW